MANARKFKPPEEQLPNVGDGENHHQTTPLPTPPEVKKAARDRHENPDDRESGVRNRGEIGDEDIDNIKVDRRPDRVAQNRPDNRP